MNKTKFLKWGLVTPLSIIGALAIIYLVAVPSVDSNLTVKSVLELPELYWP